jgi:uncharacterized membrane-anchored protein YjiN (DUF445 family)
LSATPSAPYAGPSTTTRPSAADDAEERRRALRKTKRLATGFLVAAAVVFVLTSLAEGEHPWLGYVRAFAEASMVGALADWFAVTALFRHPLGLRIPHTAIIPTRKDDIGRGLGGFVESNFLSPELVAERLRASPIAPRLGVWLAEPVNAAKVGDQVGTALRSVLELVRDDEVADTIRHALVVRVHETPVGPPLGRVLEAAMADGRHHDLLTAVLRKVVEGLEENRSVLRRRLETESPWWVPEPIDDRIFARLFDGVVHVLTEIVDDDQHALRQTFEVRMHELAEALSTSPQMQERVSDLVDEALANPALATWSTSMWRDAKASLVRQSADADSPFRQRLDAWLISTGERLRDDPKLAAKVDEWIISLASTLVAQSAGQVGEFIATTVERWDAAETTERIEAQVGRDLQFIRINGTVVGGLAGLVIYTVGHLWL